MGTTITNSSRASREQTVRFFMDNSSLSDWVGKMDIPCLLTGLFCGTGRRIFSVSYSSALFCVTEKGAKDTILSRIGGSLACQRTQSAAS